MRSPFVYPSYCTGPDMQPIVINISSILNPPLCTVPSVTEATGDAIPNFFIPEIPYFPMCPCIPTVQAGLTSTAILTTGLKPTLALEMVPLPASNTATHDCCDPTFQFDFTLEVPCLPLGVSATGTFTDDFDIKVSATRKVGGSGTDACALELELEIPCMPFKLTGSGKIAALGDQVIVSSTRKVGGSGEDACAIELNIDIPCLPLKVGGSGHINPSGDSVVVSATRKTGGSGEDACALELDIQVPCLPLKVGGSGQIGTSSAVVVSATRKIGGSGEDACALDFTIDVPCLPLKVTSTGKVVSGNVPIISATRINDPSGATPEDACAIGLDLQIPCMPFSASATVALIGPGENPKFEVTRSIGGAGDEACKLEFDIEIPSIDIGVTSNVSGTITKVSGCGAPGAIFDLNTTAYYVTAEKKQYIGIDMTYEISIPKQGEL